jgi:hypothetical protein
MLATTEHHSPLLTARLSALAARHLLSTILKTKCLANVRTLRIKLPNGATKYSQVSFNGANVIQQTSKQRRCLPSLDRLK